MKAILVIGLTATLLTTSLTTFARGQNSCSKFDRKIERIEDNLNEINFEISDQKEKLIKVRRRHQRRMNKILDAKNTVQIKESKLEKLNYEFNNANSIKQNLKSEIQSAKAQIPTLSAEAAHYRKKYKSKKWWNPKRLKYKMKYNKRLGQIKSLKNKIAHAKSERQRIKNLVVNFDRYSEQAEIALENAEDLLSQIENKRPLISRIQMRLNLLSNEMFELRQTRKQLERKLERVTNKLNDCLAAQITDEDSEEIAVVVTPNRPNRRRRN